MGFTPLSVLHHHNVAGGANTNARLSLDVLRPREVRAVFDKVIGATKKVLRNGLCSVIFKMT